MNIHWICLQSLSYLRLIAGPGAGAGNIPAGMLLFLCTCVHETIKHYRYGQLNMLIGCVLRSTSSFS